MKQRYLWYENITEQHAFPMFIITYGIELITTLCLYTLTFQDFILDHVMESTSRHLITVMIRFPFKQ